MGCDIHMYVEYSIKRKNKVNKIDNSHWRNFGRQFNPGRHYDLFGFLSKGVRGGNSPNAFIPKGLPENIGSVTFEDYYMFVIDEEDDGFEGCVSFKTADVWVKKYSTDAIYRAKGTPNEVITNVASPDWHSMNVLTLEEYKLALDNFGTNLGLIEYLIILASMESLEANGQETRLVFWFDN